MGSYSNYAEDKLNDHLLGITSYTMPTAVCIALATADPTDASTGSSMSEVSTAGGTLYARYECAGSTTWNASSSGAITNKVAITFPTAGASWGTIHGFVITDSATEGAGNALAWGTLDVDKTIDTGDTASFAIGEISISLD